MGSPALICHIFTEAHSEGPKALTRFGRRNSGVCRRSFVARSGYQCVCHGERFVTLQREKLFGALNPVESNYKTGGGFTLGAELRLNRILGVEGSYSRVRNNLTLTNLGVSPAVESGYGMHDQRLSADLVAHAPISFLGLKPYLAGGPEYDHFSQAGPSSNIFSGFTNTPLGAANKLGLNYGGGLDWRFLPFIALRLDVRDHVTTTPTYGFPSSSNTGPYFPVSGAAHDLEYSARHCCSRGEVERMSVVRCPWLVVSG